MLYDEMPIIHLELSGLKQRVAAMIIDRQGEINSVINNRLDVILTSEELIRNIESSVDLAVKKAIDEISNNRTLRQSIQDAILASIKIKS